LKLFLRIIKNSEINVILYSSLQNGILAFKNDMLNQYNYAMEFLNCLKEDLIDPLKSFMNEQNNLGKKLNTDIKKIEKDFRDSVEKMDKVKIK